VSSTAQTKSGPVTISTVSGFWFRRSDAHRPAIPSRRLNEISSQIVLFQFPWQQFGGTVGGPIN